MKKFFLTLFFFFIVAIVEAAQTSVSDLVVGGYPYYDVRSRTSIAAVDAAAAAAGKSIVCAGTYTVSSPTVVTSHVKMEEGCLWKKSGSGTLALLGGYTAGNYQVFSGWTTGLSSSATAVPTINVKHFGATGNGTTNDYQAVQDAFNFAATQAISGNIPTVYFPSGIYYRNTTSTWFPTSSVIIRGDGVGATKIKFDDYTIAGGRRDGIDFDNVPAGSTVELYDFTFSGEYETVGYKLNGPKKTDGLAQGGTTGDYPTGVEYGTIILANAASAVDDYYVGQRIAIFSGTGKKHDLLINDYDGATRTATITGNFYFAPDETSHYYIGTSPAMGMSLSGLASVRVNNVQFQYHRNQALTITDCDNVSVTNSKFFMNARGGISIRHSQHVVIADNIIQYNGDDSIFNSQSADATGVNSQHTIVTGNIIIDSNGMRFESARHLTVSNNQVIRPTSFGIRVGSLSSGSAYQPQQGITLSNNLIVDPINRSGLWYDKSQGVAYGIWLTNWRTDALWAIPGTYDSGTGSILKPEDYLYQEVAGITDTTVGYAVSITGNTILSTLPTGTNLSVINGDGFFNSRFATSLSEAFGPDNIETKFVNEVRGIAFGGPWHHVLIANNNIVVRGNAALEFGKMASEIDEEGGLDYVGSADFDYAYMDVAIKNNSFSRSINESLVSFGTVSVGRKYQVYFDNNLFDADPFHEATGRTSPLDGTWTEGTDTYCLDANGVNGIQLTANKFRNCYATFRANVPSIVLGNIAYAHAEGVGYNAANTGIAVVSVGGSEFYTIDYEGNPTSASYQDVSQLLLSSSATPTTGRYVAGHMVSKSTPSFESPRTVIGWKRLTTGATHTVGVDWAEVGVMDDTIGTMSQQDSNSVAITGGTLTNVAISTNQTITADADVVSADGAVVIRGNAQIISDGGVAGASVYTFNESGTAPFFIGHRARGTEATPLSLIYRDLAAYFDAVGYDGVAWGNGTRMGGYVDGPFTSISHPTSLSFSTISAGSTSLSERIIIDSNGKVGVGIYSSVNRPLYDFSLMSVAGGTKGIGVDRVTTSNGNGTTLEIHAGGASQQGRVGVLSSTPTATGANYAVGDFITITTGNADAQAYVTAVDEDGGVTAISLTHNRGTGYSVGTGQATSGGSGTGLTVNITSVRTATDKAGGNLELSSGVATGAGTSSVLIKTPSPGVSGTTDTSLVTRVTISSGGFLLDVPLISSVSGTTTAGGMVCWKADGKTMGYCILSAGTCTPCN